MKVNFIGLIPLLNLVWDLQVLVIGSAKAVLSIHGSNSSIIVNISDCFILGSRTIF